MISISFSHESKDKEGKAILYHDIVDSENGIIGEIDFQIDSCETAFISYLYINEEFRKKGFALESMKIIINMFKNFGIKYVTLYVSQLNERAQKLYEGLDFRYISRPFTFCFFMKLNL